MLTLEIPTRQLHNDADERRSRDFNVVSLSSITLSNFRNYEYSRLAVEPSPVVLYGANGAGKTNILEAISLLTMGRGLRRAKLSELDRMSCNGSEAWAISATVNGKFGQVVIGTGKDQNINPSSTSVLEEVNKRIVKIDGKISRGQAELANHVSLVWLTPQMEQLFAEGTSAGRKFLDRLVFSFDASHATRINEYEYAMRERNKLLQCNRVDANWLDTLETKMAECAVAIASARLSTCEHINHTITASHLSFPKAHIDVVGFEDLLKTGNSLTQAENSFRETLATNRNHDASAGRTLYGTHRSELKVTHLRKNMLAENCSMGEQKAMMLSIILAQARSGARWHGIVPIILLDEVVGHLDATRRHELFEEICDLKAQVWMTGTDAELFSALSGKAQFFEVSDGVVMEKRSSQFSNQLA